MQEKPIPILMFHNIGLKKDQVFMKSLNVSKFLFFVQMLSLKILGYKGLNMTQLEKYLNGDKKGKVVGITFDDGYENNLKNAAPILKKFQFSATCYILSENIGNKNYWDLRENFAEIKTMDLSQIKKWISFGFEIGSHGKTHSRLSNIPIRKAEEEIFESKKQLEDIFNVPIEHFCYPYGDYNREVMEIVKNAGYKTATTVNRSRVYNNDLLALPRVFITHRTYLPSFLLKILTKYEDRKFKKN